MEENADGSLPSPEGVFQIYRAEFDTAYKERTLFILTNHPHISGHGSRVAQLDRLITYMKSQARRLVRHAQRIARYIRRQDATAGRRTSRWKPPAVIVGVYASSTHGSTAAGGPIRSSRY